MKKAIGASLLAVALLLVAVVPSDAQWHRRGHGGFRTSVVIGVGPYWWGPPYPYYYYPPPYYIYAPPPVVIQEQPPVYVQQPPAPPAPPTSQSLEITPSAYWYYCPSSNAYYPNVQTCPEAWVKVPPSPG